ncbi:hypothetical protein PT974_05288 [Cladobotryum mycophilum]|uniref:Uncharacterized protein n=1 Tax=Cladobotryum mycophilum TaxID=491253 RepID=A0ABR0SIC4_9HYPO
MVWGSKSSSGSPNTPPPKSSLRIRPWGSKSSSSSRNGSTTQLASTSDATPSTGTEATKSRTSSTAPLVSVWNAKPSRVSTPINTNSTTAATSTKASRPTPTTISSSTDTPTSRSSKLQYSAIVCNAPEPPIKPPRTPTDSSYFSFKGVPYNGQGTPTWIYARDARRQVDTAKPLASKGMDAYPSRFDNFEGLPLQADATIIHIPLKPRSNKTWSPGNPRGAWRAFYNEMCRKIFDVGYHDPKKQQTGSGQREFSLANYHAKA